MASGAPAGGVIMDRAGVFRAELEEAVSEEEVVVSAAVVEDLEAGGLQGVGE